MPLFTPLPVHGEQRTMPAMLRHYGAISFVVTMDVINYHFDILRLDDIHARPLRRAYQHLRSSTTSNENMAHECR